RPPQQPHSFPTRRSSDLSKQTYIRETSKDAPATLVKIPITRERTDFDPVWSSDSKTLAVFSSTGEKEQRQLWLVNADGSNPKKIDRKSTRLNSSHLVISY